MRALVTGSNGFLGRCLVQKLRERDIDVVPWFHMNLLMGELPPIVQTLNNEIDYIFHLAAYGNMAEQKDTEQTLLSNIWGAHKVLELTRHLPYKCLVNVSSSAVTLPHQTLYAATKRAGEALCDAYRDEYTLPIVSVRPYSVYGEGEADFRFIPTVFRSCLTGEPMTLDPDATHDWIYVDDFVTELIGEAESRKHSTSPYGIGTGVSTTNRDVVKLIEKIVGKKANIAAEKNMRSFDTTDWVCKTPLTHLTPLKEGLRRYYESIKEDYTNDK